MCVSGDARSTPKDRRLDSLAPLSISLQPHVAESPLKLMLKIWLCSGLAPSSTFAHRRPCLGYAIFRNAYGSEGEWVLSAAARSALAQCRFLCRCAVIVSLYIQLIRSAFVNFLFFSVGYVLNLNDKDE